MVPCGKGGKERFAGWISRDLAEWLKSYYGRIGGAKLDDYDGHRQAWRDACEAIGAPTNTHSTRHRYARKLHLKLSRLGISTEEAVREVSKSLGHGPRRPDITSLYLGRGDTNRAPNLGALLFAWDRFLDKLAEEA